MPQSALLQVSRTIHAHLRALRAPRSHVDAPLSTFIDHHRLLEPGHALPEHGTSEDDHHIRRHQVDVPEHHPKHLSQPAKALPNLPARPRHATEPVGPVLKLPHPRTSIVKVRKPVVHEDTKARQPPDHGPHRPYHRTVRVLQTERQRRRAADLCKTSAWVSVQHVRAVPSDAHTKRAHKQIRVDAPLQHGRPLLRLEHAPSRRVPRDGRLQHDAGGAGAQHRAHHPDVIRLAGARIRHERHLRQPYREGYEPGDVKRGQLEGREAQVVATDEPATTKEHERRHPPSAQSIGVGWFDSNHGCDHQATTTKREKEEKTRERFQKGSCHVGGGRGLRCALRGRRTTRRGSAGSR